MRCSVQAQKIGRHRLRIGRVDAERRHRAAGTQVLRRTDEARQVFGVVGPAAGDRAAPRIGVQRRSDMTCRADGARKRTQRERRTRSPADRAPPVRRLPSHSRRRTRGRHAGAVAGAVRTPQLYRRHAAQRRADAGALDRRVRLRCRTRRGGAARHHARRRCARYAAAGAGGATRAARAAGLRARAGGRRMGLVRAVDAAAVRDRALSACRHCICCRTA